MVQKVRKKKAVAVRRIINEHGDEEEVAIRKVKPRRKEKAQTWVDDDFIEDSDEEMEIVARILKEREEQERLKAMEEGGQGGIGDASPSEEEVASHRSKSVSVASNLSRSSPPSSSNSTPRPEKSRKTFRSTALFLNSDDEEDNAEEEEMNSDAELLHRERMLAKRSLVMSDDEQEETQKQSALPQRKRRALIDDDDDE